jgi:hypothetical protein
MLVLAILAAVIGYLAWAYCHPSGPAPGAATAAAGTPGQPPPGGACANAAAAPARSRPRAAGCCTNRPGDHESPEG